MTDDEWLRRVTEHAYEKHHLKEDRFDREKYGQPLNLESPDHLGREIMDSLASGTLRYFSRMGGGFVAYDESKNLQIIDNGHGGGTCLRDKAFEKEFERLQRVENELRDRRGLEPLQERQGQLNHQYVLDQNKIDQETARESFSDAMQERMSRNFGEESRPADHTPKPEAEQSKISERGQTDELSAFLKAGLEARDRATQERQNAQGQAQDAARSGNDDLAEFLKAGMTARERAEHDQKHGSDLSASAQRARSDDLTDFLNAGLSAEQREAVERSTTEQSRKEREQEQKRGLKGAFGRS